MFLKGNAFSILSSIDLDGNEYIGWDYGILLVNRIPSWIFDNPTNYLDLNWF